MIDYINFLQQKRLTVPSLGFEVAADAINPSLFLFQWAGVEVEEA